MATQAQAKLFRDWYHFTQKVDQVLSQSGCVDPIIGGEPFTHLIQRPAVISPGQTHYDRPDQAGLFCLGHLRQSCFCAALQSFLVIVARVRPFQQEQIESGEIDQVEQHGRTAMRLGRMGLRAGPVEDWHEIVADRLDPIRCQRF